MAIATQVHVSRIRFLQYKKEFQTASDYLYVQKKLLTLLKEEAAADRASDQSLLREELNALLAETRRDLAYASLQNAFANIFASIGVDPLPMKIAETMTVRELASSLRSAFAAFGDKSAETRVGSLTHRQERAIESTRMEYMRPNRNQKPKGAAACVALYLLIALRQRPVQQSLTANNEVLLRQSEVSCGPFTRPHWPQMSPCG